MSVHPPPQEQRVKLAFTGDSEVGRFAVARQRLSPGEAVLSAAPYLFVPNPCELSSAVYLAARAGRADSAAQGDSKRVKRAAPAAHPPAPTAGRDGLGAEVAAAVTTHPAWCSQCFVELPAGTAILNLAELRDLCIDCSLDQDAVYEEIARQQRLAADHAAEAPAHAAEESEAAHCVDDGSDAAAAAPPRKGQRPAKAKSKSAMERESRALETAYARREAALYEHRLPGMQDIASGDGERPRGAAAASSSDDASGDAPTYWQPAAPAVEQEDVPPCRDGLVGCPTCGILVFCSPRCWQEGYTRHVASGECAALRWVWPRLMSEYFCAAPSSSGGSGRLQEGLPRAAMMPGEEPLRWSRRTSEERSLEAQCMLLMALLLTQAAHEQPDEGALDTAPAQQPAPPMAQAGSTAAAPTVPPPAKQAGAAVPCTRASASFVDHWAAADDEDGVAEPLDVAAASKGAQDAAASTAAPAVPAEVLAMRAAREARKLTGKVELLDAASAATALAQPTDSAGDAITLHASFEGRSAVGTAHVQQRQDQRQQLRAPAYAQFAALATNLSALTKERLGTYARYHRRFVKVFLPWMAAAAAVAQGKAARSAGENGAMRAGEGDAMPLFPPRSAAQRVLCDAWQRQVGAGSAALRATVSERYFTRVCAAVQCNAFGIYTADERTVAFGVYPEASYFNHSCAPNLCRQMRFGARSAVFFAMREIEAGEPLTICYTDVEQCSSAVRRRNLLATYCFFCQCERCAGAVPGQSSTASAPAESVQDEQQQQPQQQRWRRRRLPGCGLDLCWQCASRGYLRPLAPPPATPATAAAAPAHRSWTLKDVHEFECTTCGYLYGST